VREAERQGSGEAERLGRREGEKEGGKREKRGRGGESDSGFLNLSPSLLLCLPAFFLLIVAPWPKLVFAILDIVLESGRSYQMLKADLRFSDILSAAWLEFAPAGLRPQLEPG